MANLRFIVKYHHGQGLRNHPRDAWGEHLQCESPAMTLTDMFHESSAEDENWDGIDRRNTNVMLMRLMQVESGLQQHVTSCARLQKGVLGTSLFIAGWIVTHSPEVSGFLGKLIIKAGAG